MANWIGAFRTNYFEVKDADAFRAWVASLRGEDTIDLLEDQDKFGLGGYCGVPSDRDLTELEKQRACADTGENPDAFADVGYFELHDDEIDFAQELAAHLAEGQIALVYEAGRENLRYISGYAYAVNHLGETVKQVSLGDVFTPAMEAAGVTPAHY